MILFDWWLAQKKFEVQLRVEYNIDYRWYCCVSRDKLWSRPAIWKLRNNDEHLLWINIKTMAYHIFMLRVQTFDILIQIAAVKNNNSETKSTKRKGDNYIDIYPF